MAIQQPRIGLGRNVWFLCTGLQFELLRYYLYQSSPLVPLSNTHANPKFNKYPNSRNLQLMNDVQFYLLKPSVSRFFIFEQISSDTSFPFVRITNNEQFCFLIPNNMLQNLFLLQRCLFLLVLTAFITATCACEGYFCDKYFDSIVIIQTHNSLATPGKVLSPNQNFDVQKQFRDGIRGFNFDLYTSDGHLWTYHGGPGFGYDPSDVIASLRSELEKPENRNEFVVVQLEDYMDKSTSLRFLQLFKDLVITNFDTSKPLSYYIGLNKRVFIATSNKNTLDEAAGLHETRKYIIENEYKWQLCYTTLPNLGIRYVYPPAPRAAVLMNHFCSATGTGDMIASDAVNRYQRTLYDARQMMKQPYTRGNINIIHVDYYDRGTVFQAQNALREGNPGSGCWSDGSLCGLSTTCWNCCEPNSYWYGKAFTACGKEPCWGDGRICGIGTTCNACCNGHSYWYSKAFTACGHDKCWTGIRCLAGTSCNQCCNGYEWDWGQFGHFCKWLSLERLFFE